MREGNETVGKCYQLCKTTQTLKLLYPGERGPKMYSIAGITADCTKRLSNPTEQNGQRQTPEYACQTNRI
jgi:hypothetical protein